VPAHDDRRFTGPTHDRYFISIEHASDAKVLMISVAARLAGMHPQTLRQYDRLGLVQPGRAAGGGRRYSARDVELLREIQRLSQEDGVNLAGIKRIIALEQLATDYQHRVLELQAELVAAHRRIQELESVLAYGRRDLVRTRDTTTALVVWKPRRNGDAG
jgi:MerR family transcriptional regulator/heat shock protein HspR